MCCCAAAGTSPSSGVRCSSGRLQTVGSFQPLTFDIGLRMRFVVAGGLFVTSAVESLSRGLGSAASPECGRRSQPGVLNATP